MTVTAVSVSSCTFHAIFLQASSHAAVIRTRDVTASGLNVYSELLNTQHRLLALGSIVSHVHDLRCTCSLRAQCDSCLLNNISTHLASSDMLQVSRVTPKLC